MEHLKEIIPENIYSGAVWDFYFADRRIGVLDIETTGLDRRTSRFVLGGLYDLQSGGMQQVFAANTGEEGTALSVFLREIDRFDTVITYNGRHFDLPFLEARARVCGVTPIYRGYDLDLYQVLNGHSPIRKLVPNLKQKTVENYMGLWTDRTDEISGADSVLLYERFERTGDPAARERILLHNSDDVLQLTRLIRVIEKSDFHKAMYHMGFPVGRPERRWKVTKIRFGKNSMTVCGSQGGEPLQYRGFSLGEYPAFSRFESRSRSFEIELPLTGNSRLTAVDLQAAGLPREKFEKYPGFGSGFLVVREQNAVKYMEVNHFIKAFVERFEQTI